MPRRKFIDKKNATTFTVLHRPQHDPLIHDESTPSVIFQEQGAASSQSESSSGSPNDRFTTLSDLASEYGGSVRGNEGEAAEYGVYFDDTEYDYMQHMRDIGLGGEAQWIESSGGQQKNKGKAKQKQTLDDAIRDLELEPSSTAEASDGDGDGERDGGAPPLVPASLPTDARSAYSFPSWASEKSHTDRVIESQLPVPTDIAGFQPDMDPRLRETLEALEDEAFVDAEDEEDVFGALAGDGVELSLDEFERSGEFLDEDEEGWESDDTVKAVERKGTVPHLDEDVAMADTVRTETAAVEGGTDDHGDGVWMEEFSKFKKDQKVMKTADAVPPSSIMTGTSSKLSVLPPAGRSKRRKGAMTDTSSYSMTSSALFRNENQTLLDARFDKMEADYANDDLDDDEYDGNDSMSMASGMTGMSKMSAISGFSSASRASAMKEQPKTLRSDFDNMMDEFLGSSAGGGVRGMTNGGRQNGKQKGRQQGGLQQLDEIRKGLGPARVKTQKA